MGAERSAAPAVTAGVPAVGVPAAPGVRFPSVGVPEPFPLWEPSSEPESEPESDPESEPESDPPLLPLPLPGLSGTVPLPPEPPDGAPPDLTGTTSDTVVPLHFSL
jgi:hypothetical protein